MTSVSWGWLQTYGSYNLTRSTSNWRMFWAKTFWSKGAFWHVIAIVKNVSMFVDRIQNAYTATLEYSILFMYNLQTRCTRFCRWESRLCYIQDSWPSSLIEACLWCKGKKSKEHKKWGARFFFQPPVTWPVSQCRIFFCLVHRFDRNVKPIL